MKIKKLNGVRFLKDDGILVVWFTHRELEAWKSIISAIYGANFLITGIWPITTELLTRLVARENEGVLDKTLIIVAKKKNRDLSLDIETYACDLAEKLLEALYEVGAKRSELRTFLYAAAR